MANLFGILTAIVLAVASFLAFKNEAAYKAEITETLTQKKNLAASEARLELAQRRLEKTIKDRLGVEAENVVLTDREAAQRKTNEELTQQNATKTTDIAANKEKLDAIREKTAKIGDINELASKMRATKSELEETNLAITKGTEKFTDLTAQHTAADAQAAATKIRFEKYASSQSLSDMKTRIRSIYPTWGFVTLAAGDNGGVVANSTLAVVRDGTTIAKLLVTSVESNSASASIIPDSLAKDVTLMVGDRVVPAQAEPKPAQQN